MTNYNKDGDLVFCHYAEMLVEYLDFPERSKKWQNFIGLFKISLEAIWLHNVNIYPSTLLT